MAPRLEARGGPPLTSREGRGVSSSGDWKAVLIDRLTSVPMVILYVLVLAAGFKFLDADTLHRVANDLKGLFK